MLTKILTFAILLIILYFIYKYTQLSQQVDTLNDIVADLNRKVTTIDTKNKKYLMYLQHNTNNPNTNTIRYTRKAVQFKISSH